MKLFFDTSIVVDIDRGKEETVELMKKLVEEEHQLFISTVTVSEILTGAYRNESVKEAKKVLGQFQWLEMNGGVADRTAELMAELYDKGKPIEFQDVVIAASADQENTEKLVTRNTEHFNYMDTYPETVEPGKLGDRIGDTIEES